MSAVYSRRPYRDVHWTYRDYLQRARKIMGRRWSYARLLQILWNHTGFPFVGMRATLKQVRVFKAGLAVNDLLAKFPEADRDYLPFAELPPEHIAFEGDEWLLKEVPDAPR